MMRRAWRGTIGVLALAAMTLASGAARPAALPEPIDLTTLDEVGTPPAASGWDDVKIQPVASRAAGEPRFYLTGLLGESFVTLDEPLYGEVFADRRLNRSVITAGGAAGLAFERENGQLRVEVEGQGRDDVTAAFRDFLAPGFGADFRWAANDGWSALVNVWRDFSIDDQIDLYLGGGVGAGGYRYDLDGAISLFGAEISYVSSTQVAAFAWQVGGGVVWNVSDRVAFDVGYRFFSIDQADTTLNVAALGVPMGSVALLQQYTASELLFGLRIYEPFRNWR
jgi:opacity protein-like surface antigen